jgi:hypothetical protein
VKRALALLLLAGCDPLVGGECLPGWQPGDGACVRAGDAAPIEVGDGGHGGSGGAAEGGRPVVGGDGGGAGAGGPLGCEEPLQDCGGECVDLASDFDNCGACGVHCPTELCVEGACAGDPVGHVVVIGMSYADSSPSSERVLGNAVFRSLHRHLRILAWKEHTTIAGPVEAVIAREAAARSREYQMADADAGALGEALAAGAWDVVLLHDQPAIDAAGMAQLGAALAPHLTAFTEAGGTVVAVAGPTSRACDFFAAAGLLGCAALAEVSSAVHAAAPNDVVGNAVLAPFVASDATARLLGVPAPSPSLTWVFTADHGQPVVVHALFGPGAP